MSDTRMEIRRSPQAMATARSAAANVEEGADQGFSSVLAAQSNTRLDAGSEPAVQLGEATGMPPLLAEMDGKAAGLIPKRPAVIDEDLPAEVQLMAAQLHTPWMSLVGQTAGLDTQADTDMRQGVATDFLSGRGHAGLLAQRQSLEPSLGGGHAVGHAAFMAVDSKKNTPSTQYLQAQTAIDFDSASAVLKEVVLDASQSKSPFSLAADALQSAARAMETDANQARPAAQHAGSVSLQGMTAVQPQELAGLKESLQAALQRGKGAEDLAGKGDRSSSSGGSDALAAAVAVGAAHAGMHSGAQTGGQDSPAFAQTPDGQAAPTEREQEISEQVAFWAHQKNHHAALSIEHEGKPIQVQVQLNGQEAHVRFAADDEQARQLLADGQSQLRELLQAQGLQLAGVSVGGGKTDSQDGGRGEPGRSGVRQARVQLSDEAGAAPVASSRKSVGVDVFV